MVDEIELIEEYNQWRAVNELAGRDLSPTAFMVDRAKQTAYDRLEQALEYIDQQATYPVELDSYDDGLAPHIRNIKEILEGTYVEQTTTDAPPESELREKPLDTTVFAETKPDKPV